MIKTWVLFPQAECKVSRKRVCSIDLAVLTGVHVFLSSVRGPNVFDSIFKDQSRVR